MYVAYCINLSHHKIPNLVNTCRICLIVFTVSKIARFCIAKFYRAVHMQHKFIVCWALHAVAVYLSVISQCFWATVCTRRPASADRTARRQFQATGQPVSRTQASDAMTSWLPRYETKCVQRRCFQCGSVPLRSDIKGTEQPPTNILIHLERQLIALQLCR